MTEMISMPLTLLLPILLQITPTPPLPKGK